MKCWVVIALTWIVSSAGTARADAVLRGGGGIILPGTIYIGDLKSYSSVGPYLTVGADLGFRASSSGCLDRTGPDRQCVGPPVNLSWFGMAFGAYLVYADLDEAVVKSIGGLIKLRFIMSAVELRLGVGLSYQASDVYVSNTMTSAVSGFGAAPIVELAIAPASKVGIALQATGLSQPFGGNDAFSVSWYPIPTFALVGECSK
jgi:hypothetical protein